jgi:hypothetical protein
MPAAKKANSGTQMPAEIGWSRCSSSSAGDSCSPGVVFDPGGEAHGDPGDGRVQA